MGWGRTLLLGDVGNRLDIEDVERDVREIHREIEHTFRKDMAQDELIDRLVRENGELKLYLASLIRILLANNVVSKEDFTAVVSAIDSEDGELDGRRDGNVV